MPPQAVIEPAPDDDDLPINPQSGIIMQDYLARLEQQGDAARLDPNIMTFAKFVADQLGTMLTTTPEMFAETSSGLLKVCLDPPAFLGSEFHTMTPVVRAVPVDTMLQTIFAMGKGAYGDAFAQAAIAHYKTLGMVYPDTPEGSNPAPPAQNAPSSPGPNGELNIQH